ncbi:MAG: NAD(P)H-dependent oxidoreductase [Chlorobi bacterium]|nr:NAD(P)H-dependent oxidoreductase [Chlorobiota bacterium]
MSLTIAIIYGSVRTDRQGIKAARFFERKCKERNHSVSFIDPKVYNFPLLDKMYKEYEKGTAPEPFEEAAKMIVDADGYIIVSGEYNHTAPPALLNLMDHYLGEYNWKPSAIVSYSAGAFGGVRAAMHLRAYLCEIGTPSISSLFPIPQVQNAFDDEGNALDEAYDKRVVRFLDEFEWYANAMKEARKAGTPY